MQKKKKEHAHVGLDFSDFTRLDAGPQSSTVAMFSYVSSYTKVYSVIYDSGSVPE